MTAGLIARKKGITMNALVLKRDDLPNDGKTYEFEGKHYRDTEVSFIWVDMKPGEGVRLHQHPYPEIFIILEGFSAFTVGAESLNVQAGQIIVAPPNVPHKFVNSGEGQLRQIDIHLSKQYLTEWLES
jgi:mannose-6-phosphate isomerase-like protein (cupin superfamily)